MVVVNPRNQTLKTYRALTDIAVLTVDDTLDAGDVVPGFRLPVRKVFSSCGRRSRFACTARLG